MKSAKKPFNSHKPFGNISQFPDTILFFEFVAGGKSLKPIEEK